MRLGLTPHLQAHSVSQRYLSVGTILPLLKRSSMCRISCQLSQRRGFRGQARLSLAPVKARELLQVGGKIAMEKIGEIEPFTIDSPYEFITELREEKAVDAKAKRAEVERLDSHRYQIVGDNAHRNCTPSVRSLGCVLKSKE